MPKPISKTVELRVDQLSSDGIKIIYETEQFRFQVLLKSILSFHDENNIVSFYAEIFNKQSRLSVRASSSGKRNPSDLIEAEVSMLVFSKNSDKKSAELRMSCGSL